MKYVVSLEIPGIMEGTGKPEYAKMCISPTLCEMMLPGILTRFSNSILLGKLVYADNNN
jgi:K(+)-stimulated pyrophosphate-energized sodium pump